MDSIYHGGSTPQAEYVCSLANGSQSVVKERVTSTERERCRLETCGLAKTFWDGSVAPKHRFQR